MCSDFQIELITKKIVWETVFFKIAKTNYDTLLPRGPGGQTVWSGPAKVALAQDPIER